MIHSRTQGVSNSHIYITASILLYPSSKYFGIFHFSSLIHFLDWSGTKLMHSCLYYFTAASYQYNIQLIGNNYSAPRGPAGFCMTSELWIFLRVNAAWPWQASKQPLTLVHAGLPHAMHMLEFLQHTADSISRLQITLSRSRYTPVIV